MENPIIQTDLAQVLGQINQKLDKLSENVTEVKISQARLEGKVDSLEKEFKTEVQSLGKEFKTEIQSLEKEFKAEVQSLEKEFKTEIQSLGKDVTELKDSVKGIKSSATNQIWALIGVVFTAVIGLVGALGKMVFFPNP
jgi:chromosome segregation ATPase